MESGIICIAVVVWHISYDRVTEDWKVQGHNHAAVCIAALHVGAQTAWSRGEDDRLCDAQQWIKKYIYENHLLVNSIFKVNRVCQSYLNRPFHLMRICQLFRFVNITMVSL